MAGFISTERLTWGPWQALERAIARLCIHNGLNDVTIVGGPNDKGADIVATEGENRWVFQSKFRSSGSVGKDAAQEPLNALLSYKANKAVLVTNQHFSDDAYHFQEEKQQAQLHLELYDDEDLKNWYQSLPERANSFIELRDYQSDAVDSVEEARSSGEKSALVIMATGLGKSIVAYQLIANELRRNPNQEVLVLAHMTDLIKQLEQKSWSQLDKSWSTHLWTDGETPAYPGGVVFATFQSILTASKKENLNGKYGLIIVDEAHHAPAESYNNLLNELNPNFMVGMTATPWRGDRKSLIDMFGYPTYSMDIVDGMQKGFLAEVDYRMLTDGIDWDEISMLSKQGLSIKDLNSHLILPDRDLAMVETIAKNYNELESPRVLVFCKSKNHADQMKPLFQLHGIPSAVIHSGIDRQERFTSLSRFRNGDIKLLISVEMLNEGIDVPDVNLVAFMRITHSRRIFLQQLGRGLRLKSGKSKVLVLDFVADIKRIAEGIQINKEAQLKKYDPEVLYYKDGRIIKFDDDKIMSFFDEYLADIADVGDLNDSSKLKFPELPLGN